MHATTQELARMVSDLESIRMERTVSTGDRDKFGEAICAFANDFSGTGKPGYLLIGVANDGTVHGVDVTDKLLLSFTDFRNSGSILPAPSMYVEKYELDGREIIVVEVMPSPFPPVRYKGIAWIRSGPSRRKATEQDERILTERRVAQARTFDAVPCSDAALTDLSVPEFYHYRERAVASEIIAENHRPVEDQMASLRLYNTRTGHPTHAGLMLLSREPRKWLPGAYVQFLRFGGRELGDQPIVEKEIGGNLPTMLRQVEELLNVHIDERPVPVSTLREKTVANYPRWALREFFMNAVMHRNYESTQPIRFFWFADRIEIHNPGGLYGEARTDFPRNNAYRNPILAEILKNLGYVNRYGHGIARAKKELQENGNPEPAFYMKPDVFGVTVWKTV